VSERHGSDIERAFGLLGASPEATLHDLRVAFARQCRLFHPDRYAEADEVVRAAANERMREVIEAYRLAKFTITVAAAFGKVHEQTIVTAEPSALDAYRAIRRPTPYDAAIGGRTPLGWLVDAVA
jgi:hypothetical protein